MDKIIVIGITAIFVLWVLKIVALWAYEVFTMKRKGYWLDDGFSGRGRYDPKWRDKHGKRPDVPSKWVPF